MSDETKAIIESQPGSGLNEQIEYLVYEYADKANDIKKEIKQLEDIKKGLEERIDTFNRTIDTLHYVTRDLGEVERWVNELVNKEHVFRNSVSR